MIYLIEDDANIRELVTYTLINSELDAVGFSRPSEFWKAINEQLPSLILLDLMLPQEDGMTILKKLRSSSSTRKIPIIIVTAKSGEFDKVIGLDNGADDYITKPFGMLELVARVKALLRRTEESKSDDDYRIGKLYVCTSKHIVRVDGKDVNLTYKEFSMLCYLLNNRGVVLTRDKLLNEIWGYDFDGESRTVDVHIRTLRQKLGEAGDLIETVRGIGYKIGGNSNES